MGMQLNLYFKKSDLLDLVNAGADNFFVDVTTQPNPYGPTGLILVATASGYMANGAKVKTIMGCPTPCHPTDQACLSQTEAQLTELENRLAYLLQ
jgi:hypothetical protein